MNELTIEQGNKIIALFMELNKGIDSPNVYAINGPIVTPLSLKYHSSWNWLIPVVEKIESIHTDFDGRFGVHIVSNSCSIISTKLNTTRTNPHHSYFNEVTDNAKILATWKAVLQFITWYNQQNQ